MATDDEARQQPGFAPADLSDGREKLEWKTRYPDRGAKLGIIAEAAYLAILLFGLPVLLVLTWLGTFNDVLSLNNHDYHVLATFGEAWLAGTLGGAVFSMKWLYHTVGHGSWHADRRLWRIFTPVVSGVLAFALIALVTSGLFDVLDSEKLRTPSAVVGLSFLLGYFSDNTIAKLAELAERLLGPAKER